MSRVKPFSNLSDPINADPVRRARVEARQRAMESALDLAEVRQRRGLTQVVVASALEQTQANVSRIEHSGDLYLSTLNDYVTALGGQLQINAVFPDEVLPVAWRPGKTSPGR
ncbi:MAG: helix-turn-helix domain-containing protein [Chloroflexota bacterium]|nr:helix-turn-helix domain-containing protein [Chloroflexota bacterium]